MNRRSWLVAVAACLICTSQVPTASAQWGYPGGFGGFGWEGWGVGTPEGDMARGLGIFAMGAGQYNKLTAEANAIDADTVKRWNQYIYEAQMNANRIYSERQTAQRVRVNAAAEQLQKRLRDNPSASDISRGSALNVSLDEINNPLVYTKALRGAKVKIGGERIRNIPFQYAAAAINVSIDQLVRGPLPSALMTPEFQPERERFQELDRQIREQIGEDKNPDPQLVRRLLETIYSAEGKVAARYPRNSRDRNQADRFLKALHGLVSMLKTPAVNIILAGVENRPDATLGELLSFMSAFNLRFGAATTPQQREVYSFLHPLLVQLREQVAPALAATKSGPRPGDAGVEDFFSRMSYDDLQIKSPKPQ